MNSNLESPLTKTHGAATTCHERNRDDMRCEGLLAETGAWWQEKISLHSLAVGINAMEMEAVEKKIENRPILRV